MSSERPGGMGTAPKRTQKERMCIARDYFVWLRLLHTSDDDREWVLNGWVRDVAAVGYESSDVVLTRTFQVGGIRREKSMLKAERNNRLERVHLDAPAPSCKKHWHGPAEPPSPFRIAAVHRSCPKNFCVFPVVASRILLTFFWTSSSGLPLFLLLFVPFCVSFRESSISLASIECNPAACLALLFRQLLF